MSANPPPPGAASETVASPPPTNTRPLPPLLLDALLLAAVLLLDAPLVDALLLVTPLEAVLLVASPPAPLDELLVGSATEPQATSHAPASATKTPGDTMRIAHRRRFFSRWTTGLFINAFPAGAAVRPRSVLSVDLADRFPEETDTRALWRESGHRAGVPARAP
jgi:hypothetical protein